MHEILRNLPPGALALDLGCAGGSFGCEATPATVIRLDREAVNRRDRAPFVQGDAARLPFADRTFLAIIANHSLEHFDDLASALREIGRVIRPDGTLFVALPDASTLTDKLHRWLVREGGHVNEVTSSCELAAAVTRATGLTHVATKTLYNSLSYLNRRNATRPMPRRLLLLGGGYEWSLFLYAWLSRRLDRRLRTRTSVYGWALYFGTVPEPIDTGAWVNVCIRCGNGCSSSLLTRQSLVRSVFPGIRIYRCPQCFTTNPFDDDRL